MLLFARFLKYFLFPKSPERRFISQSGSNPVGFSVRMFSCQKGRSSVSLAAGAKGSAAGCCGMPGAGWNPCWGAGAGA